MEIQIESSETIFIRVSREIFLTLRTAGKQFLGIGKVMVNGVLLRNERYPIIPFIETMDGIVYRKFELKGVENSRHNEIIVNLKIKGELGDYQEMRDGYFSMIATNHPWGPVEDELRIIITKREDNIGGLRYKGIGYRYHFKSKIRKIHRLLDRATWEIGGSAEGNTVIYQGGYTKPEFTATFDGNYTTREEFWQYGMRNKTVFMQLRPRFGVLQSFDYQCGPKGTLFMYFEKPSYIKSLIEKRSGSDVFQYYDQYWFPLTKEIITPERRILFYKTKDAETLLDGKNYWFECFDFASNHYRKYYGFKEETPFPMAAVDPEFLSTRSAREILSFFCQTIKCMKQLANLGFKSLFMGPLWISDWTEDAQLKSPCAPWDFTPSPYFGGEKFLKKFCERAQECGIRPFMWISAHLSQLSPIFKEHPKWKVIHVDGQDYFRWDHVCPGNFNTQFGKYFYRRLWEVVKKCKLGGFFFDSYPNIGIMPVDYGDNLLRPSMDALLKIQKRFQDLNCPWWTEGASPFGISSNGLDYVPEKSSKQAVYHGNIQWFFGKEYALYKTQFRVDLNAIKEGVINFERYFRFYAHKAIIGLGSRDIPEEYIKWIEPDYVRLHKVYNKIYSLMENARILEEDRGVEWKNKKNSQVLLFTFKEFTLDLSAPCYIQELMDGKRTNKITSPFSVKKLKIYLITPAKKK